MAVRQIRVLINAAEFPFLYGQAGRAIVESTDLNQRMGTSFYGVSENSEWGVPQLIYCENTLPYAKGMYSVSFGLQAEAFAPPTIAFDQAIILRDPQENLRLMSPANGLNYVFDAATLTWTSKNPIAGFTKELVTRAYVNGRTFVCYEGTKILEWDEPTLAFIDRTGAITFPAGITIANVRGITGFSNYLLFWTDIVYYWCSTLDILNFNDSDHGSGSQTPLDIKGRITAMLPVSGGGIAYTARNAIGITFTNQAASPFISKEITNGGGVTNFERVTADANAPGHYAWTSNGLQKLTLSPHIAENFAPQATDFLVGNLFETWNSTTKSVDQTEIAGAYSVKLNFVASRYLIISYGQERNLFDAALVYDVGLQRWGKLIISHCDVFMYPYPSVAGDYFWDQLPGFWEDLGENTWDDLDVVRSQVTPPKRGIAFLKQSGEIQILGASFAGADSDAVMVFGHFQQVRRNKVTFQAIELEGTFDGLEATVSILLSDDGKNRDSVKTPTLIKDTPKYKRYQCRHTGMNGDVVIEGSIVLSTMMVEVSKHGSR